MDETLHKRAEETLSETNQRLLGILDHSPALISIFDQDGRYLMVSRSLQELYGLSEEEIVGKTFAELLPPDTARVFEDRIQHLIDAREPFEVVDRMHVGGKERTYSSLLFPLPGTGKGAYTFCGIATEISERVQAEAALRRERDFAESLIETAQAIVLVLDTEGRIVRFNPYMEQVSGYRLEEVQGKDWFATFLPTPNHQRIREIFSKAVSNIQTRGNVNPIVTKDGHEREIEWYDKTIKDTQGNVLGLLAVGQDITERVQAEESLRRYADRLEILCQIGQGILAARSPEAIAQAASRHIRQLLPCQRAAVMLFDLAANEGVLLAVDARGETDLAEGTRVSLEWVDQAVQTLSQGTIAVIEELAPRGNVLERLRAEGARSFVCVPLMFRGQLIGSLNLAVDDPDAFTQEYEAIAQQVADQLTIAIQQARLHEQVQRHAEDLERRVAGQTRELAVLYEVATMASQSLDVEVTLSRALERVLSAIGNDEGAIHLLVEAGGASGEETLCLSVQRSVHPDIVAGITSLPRDQDPWRWVIAHDEPLVVPDVAYDPLTGILSGMAPRSYVGVPMRARGQVVGVLSTFGKVGRLQLTLEELSLLTSVADEMGVCVESARLRGLAQEAAVLEERTRLARELHDSVTQLLYSINLFAKSGRNAYRLGDADELDHCLAELGETAQQAFKEMRLLVHELRPSVLEQEGLVGALQRRLDAVEGRAGVVTQLLTSETLECPRPVEEALYHIASEALNNALKHAAASSVSVRVDADEERLQLVVVDDGIGFAFQDVEGKGGLGIVGMRERAAKLGGTLTVTSAPGQGTRVEVSVPCTGRET